MKKKLIPLVIDPNSKNENSSNIENRFKSNFVNQVLNNFHQNISCNTINGLNQNQKQTNESKIFTINLHFHQSSNLTRNDQNQIENSISQIDNQKNNKDLNILNNEYNNLSNKPNYHYRFTAKEDEMLLQFAEKYGAKNWRLIGNLMPGRTPKQCRDRYRNYLAPGINHSEWNEEEDKLLYDKYLQFGPKWSYLCQFFHNRTANDIKNRYKYKTIKMNPHEPKIFKKCNLILPKKENLGE